MGNYTTDNTVEIALSNLIDFGVFPDYPPLAVGIGFYKIKYIGLGWLSSAIFFFSKIIFSAFIAIFSFMR